MKGKIILVNEPTSFFNKISPLNMIISCIRLWVFFCFFIENLFLLLYLHIIGGGDTEYYHELKSRFIKKNLSQIVVSQLNSVLLIQWEEQDYICLVFHVKTLVSSNIVKSMGFIFCIKVG